MLIQSMQGPSASQVQKTQGSKKKVSEMMNGAIMAMIFLLNPVLGALSREGELKDPSHVRYCTGQLRTLKTAFDLSGTLKSQAKS